MYNDGTDHRRVVVSEVSKCGAADHAERPLWAAQAVSEKTPNSTMAALRNLQSEVAALVSSQQMILQQVQDLRLAVLPAQALFPENRPPPIEESYFCRAPGAKTR